MSEERKDLDARAFRSGASVFERLLEDETPVERCYRMPRAGRALCGQELVWLSSSWYGVTCTRCLTARRKGRRAKR